MSLTRRFLLQSSTALCAAFVGLHRLMENEGRAASALATDRYGPLVRDPRKLIDLPRGFRYQIISRRGREMDDGLLVPGQPDGMATFAGPDGLTVLIRNHELFPHQVAMSPFGRDNGRLRRIPRKMVFDLGLGRTPGPGGTTTLVYDTREQRVMRECLSLAGTHRNCAGGPTPWNTWITCEETDARRGATRKNGKVLYYSDHDHGYPFEVRSNHEIGLTPPIPLKAMGRFNREAVAVDARSGIVYQTEDREDGIFTRFIPRTPGRLIDGGRLQAMAVVGSDSCDTRNKSPQHPPIPVGTQMQARWIDLDDVESPKDDLRYRGFAAGAARFARAEGIWACTDGIYFACTTGGRKSLGQIWRYRPNEHEGEAGERPGELELFVEPNDSNLVVNADNLTAAPWGDLIVCEDRKSPPTRMVGVTPEGKLYTFASHPTNCEFAGVVFSPDGTTMFVNLQNLGVTLAITGPWQM